MRDLAGVLILLSTWACAVAAAHKTLARAGEQRWPLTVGAAVLLMAGVPATIGGLTHDLRWATALSGVVFIGVFLLAVSKPRPSPPRLDRNDQIPKYAIALACVTAVLVAATALRGYYFDEDWSHFAQSNVIARGVMPLEHPLFPGQVFRYHYGFNVLVAQIVACAGVSVEHAIDFVKIPAFLLLLACAAAYGRQIGGRAGTGLALALVPLGGSFLAYFLFQGMGALEAHIPGVPTGWLQTPVPVVMVNFFQHAQGLGMAVAIPALLLYNDP